MQPNWVRDLLTRDELRAIAGAPLLAGHRHPAWFPIFYSTRRPVGYLTNQAVALMTDAGGGKA
jgi:hypothetical protein